MNLESRIRLRPMRALVRVAFTIVVIALAALPASARTHAGLVTITSGPPAKTTSTSATFTFSVNFTGGHTAYCELDGKPSGTCTSPTTYSGLAVGEHTFKVTVYAGEIGLGADSRTWLVDSTTPDFFLKVDAAQLPLTTRPGLTSTTPVKVQIVRLGGSKGPLLIQNASTSGSAKVLTIAAGIQASIVPDNAANPSALTVSLSAKAGVKTEIGKSFTLTALPGSSAVGPAARSISILYAVVDEYDLVLRGVDVTQGIQPDNPLPAGRTAVYAGVQLVKDKRTVVRVYAAVAAPSSKQVSGARIFLRGWRFKNGFAAESLGAPLVSPSVTLGSGPDAPVPLTMLETGPPTAMFTLPPYWTEQGPIALEAEVKPPSLYQPAAESECSSVTCAVNNAYKLVNVPFVDTGFVQVWAVYLKLGGGLSPCCPQSQYLTFLSSAALTAAGQLLLLADGALLTDGDDFRAEYNATSQVKLGMTLSKFWGCGSDCSLNDYLIGYSNDLEYHQVCPGTSTCPDVIMSMIDDTPVPNPWYVNGVSEGAISVFPGLYAPGHTLVNLRRPLSSVAHELGHALGLKHGSWGCGGAANGQKGDLAWPDPFGYIHGIGLDIRDGAPIYDGTGNGGAMKSTAGPPPLGSQTTVLSTPGSWYDFMSYCAGTNEYGLHGPAGATSQQGTLSPWRRTDAWISVRNWKRVEAFLALLKAAHAVNASLAALRSAGEATLSVRGFVDGGHVVVTGIKPRAGQPSARTQSDYELVLLTSRGSELVRWPLSVTSSEGHGAASTFLSADVPLAGVEPGALPSSLAELEVVSGRTVLARITRSASPPAVRLLAPTAGERVGTGVTTAIAWTATDADPDSSLEVAIDYSANDGGGWDTVYRGPNTRRAEVPSGRLSASGQARLRIRVSDGFDETPAVSGRFVAVGRSPKVTILSPRPGERSRSDAPLYLSATAYDDAGTFLEGDRVTWYDGERVLSRGRLGSITGLAPGTHVLRAVAHDANGREGTAAVRVGILPAEPAIIISRAPAVVSRRAHEIRLVLACTIPSRLSIAGAAGGSIRTACGLEGRQVVVPIRGGRRPVRLVLRAEAQGRASQTTLVFNRA